MANTSRNDSVSRQSPVAGGQSDSANYGVYWSAFVPPVDVGIQFLVGGVVVGGAGFGEFHDNAGEAQGTGVCTADLSQAWRSRASSVSDGVKTSAMLNFKSFAVAASAPAPSSGSVTANSAVLSGTYTPNTNESFAQVAIQYKKTTDVNWINATTFANQQGYSAIPYSGVNLTGLDPSTEYQTRVSITRNTVNATTFTSATGTFTTEAGAPTVTTNAASSVTNATANLNATVDPNTISCDTTFQWDTDSGAPYANETSPATNLTGDGGQAVQHAISGLSPSTTYYFRAKTTYNGGADTVFGSELSFTTAADPQAQAAQEDHMHIYEFNNGVYGEAKTVYFTLQSPAATSSDRLVTTAPGTLFAAGDIKVSKDGGAFANAANSVTQIAASNPLYSLQLSAAEMQADRIAVQIVDQDGNPAFRDALILVNTALDTARLRVDASNRSNVNGATFTGQGTGHGAAFVGGATGMDINGILGEHTIRYKTAAAGASGTITLDASASATNDFYNGNLILIVSGTGAGQVRQISDYDGASKVATVHKTWSTTPDNTSVFLIIAGEDTWEQTPGVELAAVPGATSGWGKLLQFVFQRFAYKRTQTATTHTMLKADSTTTFATAAVSDNGSLQSFNKVS